MVATASPNPVRVVPGFAAVKEVKRLMRVVSIGVSVMMMFSGSMRTVPGVP